MIQLDSAEQEYLTVQEVAIRYKISKAEAYRVAHRFPNTIRIGRAVRVYVPDLLAFEGRHDVNENEKGE